MTQLRQGDIWRDKQTWVVRISPDAGTVKTGLFRDVPLHQQIIDLGFIEFVEQSTKGPLFYRSETGEPSLSKARAAADTVAEWLRENKLVPDKISPNHAWRHRFKTVARELDVSDRVTDAICGHAGRTAGDQYGDVTIKAKHNLIKRLPHMQLETGKPT